MLVRRQSLQLASGVPEDEVHLMQEQEQLLHAWNIGPIKAIIPATSGSINQTLLVTAVTGNYALRVYRHPERQRVEDEHAIINYARAHGIPAIAPVSLPDGSAVLEQAGRFYSLFPFASGRQISGNHLTQIEWTAMGICLAQLHKVLHDFPHAGVQQRVMTIDRAAALAGIERFQAIIHALPQPTASDRYVLKRLEGQHAFLEHAPAGTLDALATLEQQPIHGDYNEANIFFDNGRVSGVIDWDQAYVAPRAWEVIRTFDLVFRFAATPCSTFLAAYRTILPLSLDELDVAAHCYGLMRAHDLWMYEAIYDHGNNRVRAFMRPEGFVPIEQQWAALRVQKEDMEVL